MCEGIYFSLIMGLRKSVMLGPEPDQRKSYLKNVSHIDDESALQRPDGKPSPASPDLQAIHLVRLEQNGHQISVRVRRDADHFVRLTARRVVLHPHRLDSTDASLRDHLRLHSQVARHGGQ